MHIYVNMYYMLQHLHFQYNRILSFDCIDALNYFADCPVNRLFTAKASDAVLSDLKDFTTAYLSVQFDKDYDGLKLLDEIAAGRR